MEPLIHYHKCLHVLTLLVLGLFAVGASPQGVEAKSRGKPPQGQDYLTSVTEANVEAVRPATRTERVQGDAALAARPQHHVSAPGGSGRDTGACCFPDGSCDDTFTSQSSCEGASGEWQGEGTDCDPNCCLQPVFTGGDDCDTAFVHTIVVPTFGAPAVTVTISGNNSAVTTGVCDMSGTDPGWYEAFNLVDASGDPAECARVTIDKCCTDPVPGADYIVLITGCSEANVNCGANVFSDDYGWAPFCGGDDGNLWNLFYGLPGGTYHYPIMSDDVDYPGCLHAYQMHITVEGCYEYACCPLPATVDDCPPACFEANRLDCDAIDGWFHEYDNEATCQEDTCEPGACCPVPGVCGDDNGAGMSCVDCMCIADARFFGGALCEDNPCPICPWVDGLGNGDPAYCIFDLQGQYMVYSDRSGGEPYPRWADDFRAGGTGEISRICWWPCFYDPYNEVECYDDPVGGGVNDDLWQIVFYADNGGIPGAIVGGPEMVTPDAKAPRGGTSRCWEYTAPLADGPIVTQGECYWIEITGYGDPEGCQVYWLRNGAGNWYSARDCDGDWGTEDIVLDVGDPPERYVDLSFCVDIGMQGACGDIPGACIVCGEDGPECSSTATEHNSCYNEGGVAFYPYMDCDSGYCEDDETWCSVSAQDCPAGLEPCTSIVPPPPVGSVCADGPVDIHTGGAKDLCPSLPCTFDFDNTCAPTDGLDPECGTQFGSDIWFEFHAQAGECGNLYIDTCENGTYDGIIAFYGTPCGVSGCPTDSSEMVSCGDDTCGVGAGMPQIGDPNPPSPLVGTPEIYICQGQSYLIRMGGWGSEYGSGQMTISFVVDPLGCDVPPCIECGQAAVRPLAEDCATIGDPGVCNDGIMLCSVWDQNCPPGLEPCLGIRCQDNPHVQCWDDYHCTGESHCVPPPESQPEFGSVCYAPKTRYLSIARNPEQGAYTARRIKLDNGTVLGWVGEPWADGSDEYSDPYIMAEVVDSPVFEQTWPDVVHVHTCEIAHASLSDVTEQHCKPNLVPGENCVEHCYYVQAIPASGDPGNEEDYSEVLMLCTNSTWGDTGSNGPLGLVCPADGIPGLVDIMAVISDFQGRRAAPLTWLDIAPSNYDQCPDQVVSLGDIMGCIAGFQGEPYPGLGPLACP